MCVCVFGGDCVCVCVWGGLCVCVCVFEGGLCVCVCLCYVCVIYMQVTIGAKENIRYIEAVGKGIYEAPDINAGDGAESLGTIEPQKWTSKSSS